MKNILLMCILLFGNISNPINVPTNEMPRITIYINEEVVKCDMPLIGEKTVCLPLVTILKKLGADIEENKETDSIYFTYLGIEYRCEMKAPNPSYPETKYIY